VLVAELAVARVNPLLNHDRMGHNPAPSCTRLGSEVSLCEQYLQCDPTGRSRYSTVLRRIARRTSRVDGSVLSVFAVSVGNQQPTAQLYPKGDANATAAALKNTALAARLPEGSLYAEHVQWWRSFYSVEHASQGSFVALPDTRLEGYYYIQQSKIAQVMRADGVGITDQTGPFRADLAVTCARAPPGANGTGWPFQTP
jgi:hypothetical protein